MLRCSLVSELFAYLGRQAIFASDLTVHAYELLYRDSFENRARFSDANQASAATMLSAFVELDLDALIGDKPVFVNLTEDFLLGRHPMPLEPGRVVLEVLETVPVTPELLAALKTFRTRGFQIALDDFELDEKTKPMVELADVIKLDVLDGNRERIAAAVHALRPYGIPLLAEKVSTQDEMTFLRTFDFEFYQGHFLEMPKIDRARRLPHNRASLVRLLAKLYDPDTNLRELESLLASDMDLPLRLIKLAGSAAMSRGAPIGTLGQAIQRIGTQQVAALVVLVMVSGFDDKPRELIRLALVRAKLCERIAARTGASPDELFTAGLLSLLDAILDQPLDEVLRQLPLTPTIIAALGGGNELPARIVAAARAQERCDFAELAASGVPPAEVQAAWLEAIAWADELVALV